MFTLEFSKRLNDDGVPLEKRLCLAQRTFESPALPVKLKEELILGWLSSRDKLSEDVWLVLQACISANYLVDLSPSVASSIVKMVCEGLKCDMSKSTHQVVNMCANKILESDAFRWSLVDCVQDYLDLIVVILDQTEDYSAFLKIVVCIREFFCSLVENKEEFLEGFVKRALFPSLKLYKHLISILLAKNNVTTLTKTLVASLQQILFPEQDSSKRVQYLDYLFSDRIENIPSESKTVFPVVISELLGALKKFPSDLCATGFCIVLQSFITVHRTNHAVVVKFLKVCFHGLGVKLEASSGGKEGTLALNKLFLSEMSEQSKLEPASFTVIGGIVKTFAEVNFMLEGDNEIHLVNLLLESCITAVQESRKQNICAEVIDMCSSVIHYIPVDAASRIFEFMVPVMMCKKCDDINLSVSYLGFLHCVFKVFSKLSRMQKLITKVLPLIRDAALEVKENVELNDVLPKDFCKVLCMEVIQLPSQQMLSIMKSFCFHFQEDCVVPLVQGKSGHVAQLYVQVLARLTSTFLLGVRVACHSMPVMVVSKFCSQLVELEEILAQYATALLAHQFEERAMTGLLEVCHSVGELHILLANYCPQTWKLEMSQSDTSLYNFEKLHPYITSEQWNIIAKKLNNCSQKTAREMINDLLLQKLVALHMFDSTGDSREQQSTIARHFVSLPSVHLSKLMHSLPQLTHLLDKQDLLTLSRNLVQAVASSQEGRALLMIALQREIMQENRDVAETLTWVSVEQIGSILLRFAYSKLELCPFLSQEMLTTYFLNRFSHSESSLDTLSSMLTNLGSFITLACEDGIIFQSDSSELIDMEVLEWHVNVLKTLPVKLMPLDIQSLVALTAVFGAVCLSKISPKSTLVNILCGEILLGLVENTKTLNWSAYVNIHSIFFWLLTVGADLEKHKHRLLFRRLFDNYLRHKSRLIDLQPVISRLMDVDGSLELSCSVLSSLLSSLHKLQHGRQQFCKKEKTLQRIILSPVAKFLEMVKAKHDFMDSAILEVFANVVMLELEMTMLIVTKLYLEEFISVALAGLSSEDDGFAQNSSLFIKLLLQQREKLSSILPQDFVHTVWATPSTHVSEQQGKLVMEAASDKEFGMIITSLLHSTKDGLTCHSHIGIQMLWWKCAVSCSLTSDKCVIRQTAVESFCTSLLAALDHYHHNIFAILKLEEAIISNPQVHKGPQIMDLCLLSISSIPVSLVCEEFSRVWPAMLSVLHHLHTHSSVWLWDRLPSMLQCYRHLISSLAAQSDVERNQRLQEVDEVSTAALGLTKFTNSLVTSSQHLKRVCPYIIADFIHEIETHNIHQSVKVHFQNCINYLLSMSDMNAVLYLNRVLQPAECELFKSMFKKYKKYFQFTGKI